MDERQNFSGAAIMRPSLFPISRHLVIMSSRVSSDMPSGSDLLSSERYAGNKSRLDERNIPRNQSHNFDLVGDNPKVNLAKAGFESFFEFSEKGSAFDIGFYPGNVWWT